MSRRDPLPRDQSGLFTPTRQLLAQARDAEFDGIPGAAEWVARLEQMLADGETMIPNF